MINLVVIFQKQKAPIKSDHISLQDSIKVPLHKINPLLLDVAVFVRDHFQVVSISVTKA